MRTPQRTRIDAGISRPRTGRPKVWEEELRIICGLLELRRQGVFHGVWIEGGYIRTKATLCGDLVNLTWAKAAELVDAMPERKPAAIERCAYPEPARKATEQQVVSGGRR